MNNINKYIEQRILHLKATNDSSGKVNEGRIQELEKVQEIIDKYSKQFKKEQEIIDKYSKQSEKEVNRRSNEPEGLFDAIDGLLGRGRK